MARRIGTAVKMAAGVLALTGVLAACEGGDSTATPTTFTSPPAKPPTPTATGRPCGDFTLAYSPHSGYEISAFIVGQLAKKKLGCDVHYKKVTSRSAWRVVARGDADAYLDAYGCLDLRARYVRKSGEVTVVGPNGMHGGVDLLAPYFMSDEGIQGARDLGKEPTASPSQQRRLSELTTTPGLKSLARSLVDELGLDITVQVTREGTGELIQQVAADNKVHTPSLSLVAAPQGLIGDGPGRFSVDMPVSGGRECQPTQRTTLCSVKDFRYLKIVNSSFARSGGPAYQLVYHYRVPRADIPNVVKLVELSDYDVGRADADAWINTHSQVWKRWLRS